MSAKLFCQISISSNVSTRHIPIYARSFFRAVDTGKRLEGQMNTKRYFEHYDLLSTTPSSSRSEFDPKRELKLPIDPKSNPDDCAPYEERSGDHNRSGMRSTEYSSVDKKEEPYAPKGGEHRYGGTKKYEWSAERLEKESEEKEKTD
ncbi:hypothetical protein NP233_g1553 [Leucocoprinus birnbaumii]|uniref:Uncharacterized protein n=1 Tax=Leucocoprinus birnbaumii TaxID=56174 RepID=A0AAD5W2C5_9AGAR|nr:hypothetical protein NP233_g1553 [Leucocoprinus birnbaumii]